MNSDPEVQLVLEGVRALREGEELLLALVVDPGVDEVLGEDATFLKERVVCLAPLGSRARCSSGGSTARRPGGPARSMQATNSASCSGGITQYSILRFVMPFFLASCGPSRD